MSKCTHSVPIVLSSGHGSVRKARDKSTNDIVGVKKIGVDSKQVMEEMLQKISGVASCNSKYVVEYKGVYVKYPEIWVRVVGNMADSLIVMCCSW